MLDRRYAVGALPARPAQPRPQPRLKAEAPEAIWGQFNNYRSNGLAGSAAVHIILLALILGTATFGHQVVQRVQPHETVTLIAPSPDSYALPVAKKIASGGGGGGEHDVLQAPKGRLPKLAMEQITPPQIVIHNQHPKLAVEPTVVKARLQDSPGAEPHAQFGQSVSSPDAVRSSLKWNRFGWRHWLGIG